MMCLPDVSSRYTNTAVHSGKMTGSSMACMTARTDATTPNSMTSPRKNKRKSQEPRKFHLDTPPATPDEQTPPTHPPSSLNKRRRRLNSTGSDHGSSPDNSDSRTPSPVAAAQKEKQRMSPLQIAPKKRFKLEALRELQRLEEEESNAPPSPKPTPSPVFNSNPFRPWKESVVDGLHAPPQNLDLDSRIPLQPELTPALPALMQRLSREMQLALFSAAVQGASAGAIAPLLSSASLPPLSILAPPVGLPIVSQIPQLPTPLSLVTPPIQEEPLSLVKKKPTEIKIESSKKSPLLDPKRRVIVRKGDNVARQKAGLLPKNCDNPEQMPPLTLKGVTSVVSCPPSPTQASGSMSSGSSSCGDDKSKQRNYKNLTRARRIEANARERQRVHTITAAFDTLQAAIPTDEDSGSSSSSGGGVKLSKLSVIKIATAYIMALSRMAGYDYTEDQSAPSLESVIQNCRQTIINETRIKKRA